MRLLLDTHVLLWWFEDDRRLGRSRALIADPTNDVSISIVSLWEIAIKSRIGKLNANVGMTERQRVHEGFDLLDVRVPHLEALAALPHHHRDPFDHLLIAQAQVEGLTFVTADRHASLYPVDVVAVG
ncbi:MAG: type II toxin-antitoxin system VapC family toxin [Sphingomicrobium sp.]|nr:type II toxin-antitoxin system VapC family toxin [Sphingomonadales bacterium]